jgi:hypothetical protein
VRISQRHAAEGYYHDYRIVEVGRPEKVLEGLRLVFVELPKYRESRPQDARKLRWAWLKFLKEAASVGKQGHPTAEEFREQVGITGPLRQALEISEECGFTPEQLERYDAFWDAVSRERTLMSGKYAEGHAEGETTGLLKAAAGMKTLGLDSAAIAQATGLPLERVAELWRLRTPARIRRGSRSVPVIGRRLSPRDHPVDRAWPPDPPTCPPDLSRRSLGEDGWRVNARSLRGAGKARFH